ncbi:MAG: IS66 family insertion sequence element accessory protein TnpB [Saprospiraceae bacterium]
MEKSQRIQHIKYWEQSGQSKKAYCELAGIKYATFMSWFKLKEEEVISGQFLKLEKPKDIMGLEIVLPNGIRIYSEENLTVDLIKTLQSV